jgi:hypothetical protein
MGMGAGFGMMMPTMLQQAMQGLHPTQGAAPAAGAVAAGVGAAAGTAAAGKGGVSFDALSSAAPSSDPRDLVRNVAQSSEWKIQENGDVWQITVPIGSLRKQTVTVNFAAKDEAGHGLISYSSACGPTTPQNAMLLLKFNQQMVHGAFAVESTSSGDVVVVHANQLADTADALEVTRVLTAVAWQADKAEEKLTGGDDH